MKICYKIEVVESIGRYDTLQTTRYAVVVESNVGFYAIQSALLKQENLVRFRVVESFPVAEIDLDTDINHVPKFIL